MKILLGSVVVFLAIFSVFNFCNALKIGRYQIRIEENGVIYRYDHMNGTADFCRPNKPWRPYVNHFRDIGAEPVE